MKRNLEHKADIAQDLVELIDKVKNRIKVLNALDEYTDCSGCHDLHDQLTTMHVHSEKLSEAVERIRKVASVATWEK